MEIEERKLEGNFSETLKTFNFHSCNFNGKHSICCSTNDHISFFYWIFKKKIITKKIKACPETLNSAEEIRKLGINENALNYFVV